MTLTDKEWLDKLTRSSPAIRRLRAFFGKQEVVNVGILSPEDTGINAVMAAVDKGHTVASWAAPKPHEKPPTHTIWVPESSAAFEADRDRRARIVETGLRHESWHARETDRDAGLMQYAADRYHIPAAMYNVFEDARIEDIARWHEYTDFGYFAGRDPLYDHKRVGGITRPLDLFQYLVMCEGYTRHEQMAVDKWRGVVDTKFRGRRYNTTELIRWFVRRAQQAMTTRALWPVMLEFIEAFPEYTWEEGNPTQQNKANDAAGQPVDKGLRQIAPSRGRATKGTDESADGNGPDEGAGEGEGEGDEGDGKDGKTPGGHGYTGKWVPGKKPGVPRGAALSVSEMMEQEVRKGDVTEKVEIEHGLEPFVFSHTGETVTNPLRASKQDRHAFAHHTPNLTDAPAIAHAIRRMVGATDSSRVRTSTSGTHVHMTTVMTGAADAFRRTITRKGRRRVCLVMDMSGSMCGAFQAHGGAFIEAMLILHRQGVFEVDVYLSGGGQCHKLAKNTKTEVVSLLYAHHGCESIMATLEEAKPDVIAADTVLVYTDGQLTDGDIDTKKWRSRGVDLIGVMAVGNEAGHFEKHDDKVVPVEQAGKELLEHSRMMGHAIVDYQKKMNAHFHKAIVADGGRELASRIAQYVLSKQV